MYNLWLVGIGAQANPVRLIKAIRSIQGISLLEAKTIYDNVLYTAQVPQLISSFTSLNDADAALSLLTKAGAAAEIVPVIPTPEKSKPNYRKLAFAAIADAISRDQAQQLLMYVYGHFPTIEHSRHTAAIDCLVGIADSRPSCIVKVWRKHFDY
jgi:hypothetical protein